jgi:hypothetical protein
LPALDNDGEFEEVRRADQATLSVMNDLRVTVGLGFTEKDGSKR